MILHLMNMSIDDCSFIAECMHNHASIVIVLSVCSAAGVTDSPSFPAGAGCIGRPSAYAKRT